ncbi:hypothetical protein SK854_37830 [Lentzea sp. BCCO 10_0061]|uniref:Uncharacterized protein n=1 Tax=Lentzea sokolovensis TaxID=3095429 RepID=A0ABU4V845_9PSEU|nr:hypothetical protein [Lentzea sp. BCCO 10_0061]MDX8147924.1 hypothetical protein [Lentzea sp. BCCO 10_0061]
MLVPASTIFSPWTRWLVVNGGRPGTVNSIATLVQLRAGSRGGCPVVEVSEETLWSLKAA